MALDLSTKKKKIRITLGKIPTVATGTLLVILATSSPWESERRKETSRVKERKNFMTVLPVMKGKAILGFDIVVFNQWEKKKAVLFNKE